MRNLRIGVQIVEPTAPAAVAAIERAEALGMDAAWMTVGGVRPDSTAIFAAAAMRTGRILLGTSIVPTYPRHPWALGQEAKAVAQLAPGRFRLGVGPSHKPSMEGTWGIPFLKPLAHLREYLQLLKAGLQQGGLVEFQGQFFKVRGDWGDPVDVRVMASGLRRGSFTLIGELADGGISWVSPLNHIERVAIPALQAGAAQAGRERPAMVMHVGVAVHEQAAEVHEAAVKVFSHYPTLAFYRNMFVEAGFPEAADGSLSPRMVDGIVLHGSETQVADGLRRIAAAGVDEVICTVVGAGADPKASAGRTLRLLADLSQAE